MAGQHNTSKPKSSPVAGSRQTRRTPSAVESPLHRVPFSSSVVQVAVKSNVGQVNAYGQNENAETRSQNQGGRSNRENHDGKSAVERSRVKQQSARKEVQTPAKMTGVTGATRLPSHSIVRKIIIADESKVVLVKWAQDRPELIERFRQIVADSEVAVFKGVFAPINNGRGALILVNPLGAPPERQTTCAIWEDILSPRVIREAIAASQARFEESVA